MIIIGVSIDSHSVTFRRSVCFEVFLHDSRPPFESQGRRCRGTHWDLFSECKRFQIEGADILHGSSCVHHPDRIFNSLSILHGFSRKDLGAGSLVVEVLRATLFRPRKRPPEVSGKESLCSNRVGAPRDSVVTSLRTNPTRSTVGGL